MGRGNFWGKGQPIVKYRDTLRSPERKWLNRSWCCLDCGLRMAEGIELVGVQIPHEKGQFWGKGSPIVKFRDFLLWAVQKWLNWLICHLGCGLGWTEGSTSSVVFARWRQCSHMGGHISAAWRIRLNHPSAAAMWCYVKLLWPLVMAALCNRGGHYIFALSFLLLSFISSPNLSRRRLDVYHTSTHGVALVQI